MNKDNADLASKQNSKNNWHWFEDCLTYSNYKLPEALFRSYRITKDKDYLQIAEKSIKYSIIKRLSVT